MLDVSGFPPDPRVKYDIHDPAMNPFATLPDPGSRDDNGTDKPDPFCLEGLDASEREEVVRLLSELATRHVEALNLYEPLPFQDQFHASTKPKVLMQKGNQVGGSLCGFVEDARAATGQDPYGKYVANNGVIILIGYGEDHIGRVMYKYLFEPGAFHIIKDLVTGDWRTYHPWPDDRMINGHYGDESRDSEKKPAPPLIPERMVKSIAWDKRSIRVFKRVELTNGWVIHAQNSGGDFAQVQGFQADLVHIDEDVATGGWLEEMVGRTMTRQGRIRWTALPHAKTNDIVDLMEEAEEEAGTSDPKTEVIKVTIYDNPFLTDAARDEAIRQWKRQGEDVYRKRALGELTISDALMYPMFHKDIHNAIKFHESDTDPDCRPQAMRDLVANNGIPPTSWCKYLVFDPGYQVGAIGLFATPPPSLGDFRFLYDEIYIRHCTAAKFGNRLADKQLQNQAFQEFIIDSHGANLRDFGSGLLPRAQYEAELEKHGIKSINRGSRFMSGSDDITGREMTLRSWLEVNATGWPKLMVVVARCPQFTSQMQRFRKKTVKISGHDVIQDEGNRRAEIHMCEVGEYGAAHGLKYVAPPSNVVGNDWAMAMFRAVQSRDTKRRAMSQTDNSIVLGATGVAKMGV